MKILSLSAVVLVLVGCSGSASLVLQTPVSNQCAKVGLLGCDEISEGVLLYAEGRGSEGATKLQSGAAQNSPEKVREFATLLGTLSNLPGAGKYTGALSAAVATLTLAAPSASARELEARESSGQPSSIPLASDTHSAVTADTDVAQNRSGLAEIPSYPPEWCAKFGKGTSCVLLTRGPFFLTDARAPAPECEGQFLAIIAGGQVTVELKSPLMIHGGRILVPAHAALVLGQRPEPPEERPSSAEKPAEKPTEESHEVILDDVAPEWSCPLYWSGFVPYETKPANVSLPVPRIERQPEKSWNQNGGF